MTHHDLIHRMAAELDHYRQLLGDDRREVHPLAVEARAVLAASVTSPPDWRGLCEELAEELERAGRGFRITDAAPETLSAWSDEAFRAAARARAALAQAFPEVVGPIQLPEQAPDEHPPSNLDRREIAAWYHGHGCGWQAARAVLARWGRPAPAPAEDDARIALSQPEPEVVGPTDGSGKEWQWYTYCPEEGIELYSDSQQAQSAAQSIMGSYEVAAHSDGWHEDMELVSWGMLVPVEHAQVVARGPADPGGEFDEWVRYELRASRPAPAPAGEVEAELALNELEQTVVLLMPVTGHKKIKRFDTIRAALKRLQELEDKADLSPAPAPAGERQAAPVPDCERNWDSLLSPSGGYEMADDAALRDGAQLINGEWWAPVFGCDSLQAALDRIRERLERQAAPVPVAVSERPWEREGWCHPEERWAWFYNRRVGWRDAIPPESLKPPTLFPYTYSLPFNALPIPSMEVDHG